MLYYQTILLKAIPKMAQIYGVLRGLKVSVLHGVWANVSSIWQISNLCQF